MNEGNLALNKVIGPSASEYAAAREKAQTIVSNLVREHERELAGWNYLQLVMAKEPPNSAEEAALHVIFSRARRERY